MLPGSASSNRSWFLAECVINLQRSLPQSVVDAEGLHKLGEKINKLDKVVEGEKKNHPPDTY